MLKRIMIAVEPSDGTLVVDTPDRGGMQPVGRSDDNMYEALGRWLHSNREYVGVTIDLDDSAIPFEMVRREKELAER